MPTELKILDTDFATKAVTGTGAAGTSTGAGDGWIDLGGAQWNIALVAGVNRLVAANTNDLFRNLLVRPVSEDIADQRIQEYFTYNANGSGANQPFVVLRVNRSTYDCYAVSFLSGNQRLYIYKYTGATKVSTTLAQGAATGAGLVAGTQYLLDAKIVGNTITATLYKVSDMSQVQTLSWTDSSSPYTGASTYGITHQFNGTVDRLVTYNEDAPAATGYTATGPSGGLVNADSTDFTVSLSPSGSIPATDPVTITPSDGSNGVFTPTSVTLGTAAGQQKKFKYKPLSSGVKTIAFANNGGFANPASISYTASAAALTGGAITQDAIGVTSIQLTAAPSTGGTGALTYQWYRSETANFTPGAGNILAGKTGLTLVDTGLKPDTLYFYKLVTTDSLAVTTVNIGLPIQTRIENKTLVFGAMNDSLGAYKPKTDAADGGVYTMLDMFIQALRDIDGNRQVLLVNSSVAGRTSVDWQVSGAAYIAARAAFIAAGVTHVPLMLGANDSRNFVMTTPAAYKANIAAIIADLNSIGIVVILMMPTYTVPGSFGGQFDEQSVALAQQYTEQLKTLVNGSTVLLGDTRAFGYFSRFASTLLVDGVHPNAAGAARLAWLWAMAVMELIGFRNPRRSGPAALGVSYT